MLYYRHTMTKKVVLTAIVAGFVVALITNQNFRDRILPRGGFDKEPNNINIDNITPEPIPGRPQVELNTPKGKIVIELRPDLAPKSVANFLDKWNSGYCNELTFHRVEDWVIQGCDPKGDGTGGKLTLPTEISSESFTTGSVGVARLVSPKELSNDSQFFIVKSDAPSLNGEYTYIGKVVSGIEVLGKITRGDKIGTASVLSK